MRDSQLKRICKSFRDGILDGQPSKFYCYAVSTALQGYLSTCCNLETELIEGEVDLSPEESEYAVAQHFWLKRADGTIIDATADQFPHMLPVYIGEQPRWYHEFNPATEKQVTP